MKRLPLTRRMNHYASAARLASSTESEFDVTDALVEEDIVEDVEPDEDYLPNPVIAEEIAGEINPETPISNYDTAVKLLSDNTEAMRRLDVIRMNVNYPVSGYRNHISNSTILKADPGLESVVPSTTFTRRQLNIAIEAKQSALMRVALSVIAGLIAGTIYAVSALLFRRMKHKRNGIDEIKFKNLFKAAHSKDKLVWTWADPILSAKAPGRYKMFAISKDVKLGEFINAIFMESVWDKTSSSLRAMVAKSGYMKQTVDLINSVGNGINPVINDVTALIKELDAAIKNNTVTAPSDIIEKHAKFIGDIGELDKQLKTSPTDLGDSSNNLVNLLKPMEDALKLNYDLKYEDYDKSYKTQKDLEQRLRALSDALRSAKVDENVASSVNMNINAVKEVMVRVASAYTAIGKMEQDFSSLEKSIDALNSDMKGAW